MGEHLGTIDMCREWGTALPLFLGGGTGEGRRLKQLQSTSTNVELLVVASQIITLEGKT